MAPTFLQYLGEQIAMGGRRSAANIVEQVDRRLHNARLLLSQCLLVCIVLSGVVNEFHLYHKRPVGTGALRQVDVE